MSDSIKKDQQSVTSDGELLRTLIEGVAVKEINNVVTKNGVMVELFRPEWATPDFSVNHIIHVSFRPGALSAWHYHKLQTSIGIRICISICCYKASIKG